MKYDIKKYDSSVDYYKKELQKISKKVKLKTILVAVDYLNKDAYLSVAPLSQAAHQLNLDMYAVVVDKDNKTLKVIFDTYAAYDAKVPEMMDFVKAVKKKYKEVNKLFIPPELILTSGRKKEFKTNIDNATLKTQTSWFKIEKYPMLKKTAGVIWDQVMNLKKKEIASVGFELTPKKPELPLKDYLDSYFIAMAMAESAHAKTGKITMGAATSKPSLNDPPVNIADLLTTLKGCEYSKEIDEPVFKKYKKLSPILGTDKLKQASAMFGLKAEGYPGKHQFGEKIGYPSPNKKTRWQTPGQMFLKFDWFPQTKIDNRKPQARLSFTETLPIDIFIKTNNIDWFEMRKRNIQIAKIIMKSDYVMVKGKKVRGGKTEFKVDLIKPNGTPRTCKPSDIETRNLINPDFKKKGIFAGTMANLPGGEAFVTPERMKGTLVGDVVISVGRSYRLSEKQPLVIEMDGDYKVKSGPKKVVDAINKQKKDAWARLLKIEKSRSMPKELIAMKKKNFNNIGEFAVNTNPKAELCDYLIVNEKIANMIHVALGSGFEPDRSTEYHDDIVINAPKQELDIYGVDKKGKERWIMKKGKFVI